MGPGPVLAIAVIMAGATAITYTVFKFIYQIQKARVEAREGGVYDKLSRKIDRLTNANEKLKRRVEVLESIVVDQDAEQLSTSFDSKLESDSRQDTTVIEVNVDENLSI